jgi:hypothetical protein
VSMRNQVIDESNHEASALCFEGGHLHMAVLGVLCLGVCEYAQQSSSKRTGISRIPSCFSEKQALASGVVEEQ